MAVGLDTPASALELLDALHADGMHVERPFADGDDAHARADRGRRPRPRVPHRRRSSPRRRCGCRSRDYLAWYATLPASLRDGDRGALGPAAGRPLRRRRRLRDRGAGARQRARRHPAAARLRRGPGRDLPRPRAAADPPLPRLLPLARRASGAPTRSSTSASTARSSGCRARCSRSRPACAPDAALGDVPLVYPFVVNDPGEGVQAKRRAHAVIVDHLVPPMMRADTYDELAELEALLDEYARLEVLDPPKLPALAARIWAAIERANLQADLGVSERPDDLGALVEHIDGYLCEVKDIQIKDGLHVLGRAPEGEQLRGLVGGDAAARVGRRARAAARGRRGVRARRARAGGGAGRGLPGGAGGAARALPRVRRPAPATRSTGSRRRRWRCSTRSRRGTGTATAAVASRCSAAHDDGVERALRFAARRGRAAHPRAPDELDRHRRRAARPPRARRAVGRADARARRRAADRAQLLLRRPARAAVRAVLGRRPAAGRRAARAPPRDAGELPRMVGLVAWGTSAMRTQGDDVAEILALLGVRPIWHPESRRVTGIEVDPARRARPAADRRHRAHLGLLPRRLPAPRARCSTTPSRRSRRSTSRPRTTTSRRTRAPTPSAWPSSSATAPGGARPRASSAPSPGTYGAGLLQLARRPRLARATATSPRSTRPGAATPTAAAWTARRRARPMRECFARIDVAVKNVDSREHDILDSDDYYQYHGGMVATVRALTRRGARGVPRRLARTRRAWSTGRWPRRPGACSAPAWPTRAGSRR